MTSSNSTSIHIIKEFETNQVLKNLLPKLQSITKTNKPPRVTVLPDFFVDRIIEVTDHSKFVSETKKKIKAGGGSMRGYSSVDIKGGNAVNVAYCMAKLGICIDLYTVADKIGNSILKSVFAPFGEAVKLYVKKGKQGLSTVFEFSNDQNTYSPSNVMVSDVGDNDNFGPDILESKNFISNLRSSDAVILTNWASNLMGTDLLHFVFKNSPDAVHFLDPADIEQRCFEFINMLKTNSNLVNFLSINENEFNQLVEAFQSIFVNHTSMKNNNNNNNNSDDYKNNTTNDSKRIRINNDYLANNLRVFDSDSYPHNIDAIYESVKTLSNYFNLTVCLHTTKGSVMSTPSSNIFVQDDSSNSEKKATEKVLFTSAIFPSKIDLVSGAGDSWDAGFMFGHLHRFEDIEKLCFANLLASLHIENLFKDDPSLCQVIDHIKSI
jgi:ribokinase